MLIVFLNERVWPLEVSGMRISRDPLRVWAGTARSQLPLQNFSSISLAAFTVTKYRDFSILHKAITRRTPPTRFKKRKFRGVKSDGQYFDYFYVQQFIANLCAFCNSASGVIRKLWRHKVSMIDKNSITFYATTHVYIILSLEPRDRGKIHWEISKMSLQGVNFSFKRSDVKHVNHKRPIIH